MLEINNCWETKKCGREPGGLNAHELGVCPAATDKRYHGVNRGNAGGRFCWNIDGTLCHAHADGPAASCTDCGFVQEVEQQEGRFFVLESQDLSHPTGPSDQAFVVLEAKPPMFVPDIESSPHA